LEHAVNKHLTLRIRRLVKESQIRQCKQYLAVLEKDLHDIDMDIMETDDPIGRLKSLGAWQLEAHSAIGGSS
jgi:hypothetical protein